MGLPYTESDWLIFVQKDDQPDRFEFSVLRGPVPTQILQQRLQQILDSKGRPVSVLLYESIRVIIFQEPLSVEQINVLRGDSS